MRKYFLLSAITALFPTLLALPGEAQTSSTTTSTTTVAKTRPVLRIKKKAPKRVATSTSKATVNNAAGTSVNVRTETQITK